MGDLGELVGIFLGFFLTVSVFSYIFVGDNPLFRIAIHAFIGVAAAIAVVMVVQNVLVPQLLVPLLSGDVTQRLALLPLVVFCAMLLGKASRRLSGLGQPVLAGLVGVVAAAAVGGAVLGTLSPQALATANQFAPERIAQNGGEVLGQVMGMINAIIMLVGTLAVLFYFQFTTRSNGRPAAKRSLLWQGTSAVGQFFIAITFGVLFAGVYSAALTALIERLNSIIELIWSFTIVQ